MLFRPMVHGVPAQVLGVRAVGMASSHGDEDGGDVTASGGEDTGDLVRRRAGKLHRYGPSGFRRIVFGQLDFGVACLDHPPETVTPWHSRFTEYLVHATDVGPQRRVRVGRVLENRLDTNELAHRSEEHTSELQSL